MNEVQTVIGALVGAGVGFAGGFAVGRWIHAAASWVYWTLNGVALVVGIAASYYGLASARTWVFVAGVAFMGGAFSGMKYGYGQVVAPWEITKAGAEERRDG